VAEPSFRGPAIQTPGGCCGCVGGRLVPPGHCPAGSIAVCWVHSQPSRRGRHSAGTPRWLFRPAWFHTKVGARFGVGNVRAGKRRDLARRKRTGFRRPSPEATRHRAQPSPRTSKFPSTPRTREVALYIKGTQRTPCLPAYTAGHRRSSASEVFRRA
jgi:hypothetical protein